MSPMEKCFADGFEFYLFCTCKVGEKWLSKEKPTIPGLKESNGNASLRWHGYNLEYLGSHQWWESIHHSVLWEGPLKDRTSDLEVLDRMFHDDENIQQL